MLPAAADNAAMEAEPPHAEPPKRKRRWFQFSLRSPLVFTAAIAVASGGLTVLIESAYRQAD